MTRRGLYKFNVLTFGMANATACFMRLMNLTLSGLTWLTALVYVDDVVVFAQSFDELTKRLKEVLERIRGAGLKLKPSKCHLYKREIRFLGYIIKDGMVRPDSEKVKVVADWPKPSNLTETRSFVSLA